MSDVPKSKASEKVVSRQSSVAPASVQKSLASMAATRSQASVVPASKREIRTGGFSNLGSQIMK